MLPGSAFFVKKKSGTPMSAPPEKQITCRFVRFRISFCLTFVRSFGMGTSLSSISPHVGNPRTSGSWRGMGQRPISFPPRSLPSVRMKYASRQAACLKQRKAQQHRVPHACPNRRGYVALHRNAAHQYGINRHADDDEKRLKPQRKKTSQIVLPHLSPFAVRHRRHRDGRNRGYKVNLDHASIGDDENANCQRPHRKADKHALHP